MRCQCFEDKVPGGLRGCNRGTYLFWDKGRLITGKASWGGIWWAVIVNQAEGVKGGWAGITACQPTVATADGKTRILSWLGLPIRYPYLIGVMCFISFLKMVVILPDPWTLFTKRCPNPSLDLVKTSWPILETSPTSLSWKISSFPRVWAHYHTRWVPNKWWFCKLIIFMSCWLLLEDGNGIWSLYHLSELEENILLASHPADG